MGCRASGSRMPRRTDGPPAQRRQDELRTCGMALRTPVRGRGRGRETAARRSARILTQVCAAPPKNPQCLGRYTCRHQTAERRSAQVSTARGGARTGCESVVGRPPRRPWGGCGWGCASG
jgi:hypothetical protein